ncbi:MAG TPA: glycosyltransferase [Candidatus Saccharimonadales bacterium]|nr:glycosyltransferase [Candidatus Saccharimonadales bacterium]
MANIAIITRTKDRPVFLRRALKSVSSQSYTDYEHVIINDNGDQAAVEKAVTAVDESRRAKITVIHRDTPSAGPDTIFTESVDLTKSNYVVIHDDDDSWHPDFLARTTTYLDEHPNLGGVVTRTDKVIERVEGDGVKTIKTFQLMPEVKVINLYRQCVDNQLTPIAFVYRRQAYEAVGKYDSSLPVCGDWEFGIRLLQQYDVDFLDPGYALAYYHHRQLPKHGRGDNSFAAFDHRYYVNLIMNRYLRQELKEGKLGVGYIMNQARYNQSSLAQMIKRLLPRRVSNLLKNRVSS